MNSKEKTKKSKELSFLLRHDTDYDWNSFGWRKVSDLTKNHSFTVAELKEIVADDEKGRYEFDEYCQNIRATQGHSIPGIFPDLKLVTIEDCPDELYHGTSSRFVDSILKSGICKMSRNFVQLSPDTETAAMVGKRHGGNLVIFSIKGKQMIREGVKVYKSKNNVYMTDFVNPKYFSFYMFET